MTESSTGALVAAKNVPEKGCCKKKEKKRAQKPKKDLEVVVVPKGYPKLSFDQDLFDELRAVIKAKITEIDPGKEFIPQLDDCYLYKDLEAGVFKCSNGVTKSWICQIVSKIILRGFMKLYTTTLKQATPMHKTKVHPYTPQTEIKIPTDNLCRVGLLLSRPLEKKNNILKRITSQNPELNVCKWVNIDIIKKDNCAFFVFSIPPDELNVIGNMDYSICYGLSKETVFEITDEDSLRVLDYRKKIEVQDYEVPYSSKLIMEEDNMEETPENYNIWFNACADALEKLKF